VFQTTADGSRVWSFSLSGGRAELAGDLAVGPAEPLPPRLVSKDWRAFFQSKVNVAWLPAEEVFVRVVHLPTNDPAEIRSMVELQLEKLSPLPLAQIVWSYELVPSSAPDLQTVVVIIAARSLIEEFLGSLERRGYLADRVELPTLHQLLATKFDEDGLWIYPDPNRSKPYCLLAWWYGNMLRSVSLLPLPSSENWHQVVSDEISRMAWAGEIDGWLNGPPRCHLVADAPVAAVWEPLLRDQTGQPVTLSQPTPAPELAAMNATWLGRGESRANLLPAEHATRYRQQFVDRIWMRGLGAAIVIYLIGVTVYFGFLQYRKYQVGQVEQQVAGLQSAYTNALQLRDRIRVMQEQQNLKYAALDGWKAVTETLPTELILKRLIFQKGQKLVLAGIGAGDQVAKVTDYSEALSKLVVNSNRLFLKVTPQNTTVRPGELGAQTTSWGIECELQRAELK
jgi:hypothetical protein